MHPVLADKKKLFVYLAAWLIVGLLISALFALPGDLTWLPALVFAVPLAMFYAFVCLSAWYVCRAFPLQKTDFTQIVLIYALASGVTSSLWVLLSRGWAMLLAQSEPLAALTDRPAAEVRLLFGAGLLLYLLAVAIHYLIMAFEESRQAERRTLELMILAQSAELRALKAQINPHFLFNSLNSISALTSQNPPAARTMAESLANFLRRSLRLGTQDTVTLEEEISLSLSYLDIEQIRFGSRLKIEMNIEEDCKRCPVPPLILQPLIENAINHGIAQLVEGGTITLTARRNGSRLLLNIQNPCDPDRKRNRGTGMGLENVRSRLRAQFEAIARLDTTESDKRFRVDLTIPLAS